MHEFAKLTLITLSLCAAASAETREDQVLLLGNVAGKQTVQANGADYSYNDRGRGAHIAAIWKLDAAGVPSEYIGHGNDYMKAPVDESFRLVGGKAEWKNRTERGSQSVAGEAFFVPLNAPPEMMGVLARALLKSPTHTLPLLPSGEARIENAGTLDVDTPSGKRTLTEYQITGLDFSPDAVWLDNDGSTAARVSSWFTVISAKLGNAFAQLQAKQDATDAEWTSRVAKELTHVPSGALVIRNARLFDPRDLSVTPHTSVLIEGERIVRVAADGDLKVPANAEIIDANNRFLMPGLWDNHQHFGDNDGALDLIAGVTSSRDMANDTDGFLKRVARFDDGTELGPRVLKAGIIDGTGEFAGPTKMRVDTADEALKDVDWYADHGYAQIKIYSSVKPELVPVIADRAHARGLRVSGHVPAFMSARQFVDGGADEIQHIIFVVLNFLYPQVQETRNRDRFIKVAEHAFEFTPDKPQVREFIDFLKRHHTVIDPTLGIEEATMASTPGAVPPGMQDFIQRFPPQVRRSQTNEWALVPPKGQEAAYRDAFPALMKLVRALYDAGVTIIPGTDSLAGYMLHYELEIYVRAWNSPAGGFTDGHADVGAGDGSE